MPSLTVDMAPRFSDGRRLSNTRVDRLGGRVRTWYERDRPELVETDEELRQALWDFFAWRDTFRYPLTKVVMGLRSFVKSERPELRAPGTRLPVGQRLKREPQIIRKLSRYPKMKLSRMQDIGGCRAIMPGGAREVAGVLARIQERWEVLDLQNYVERPQDTGYRAIHVVVRRDQRRIEIQLRTHSSMSGPESSRGRACACECLSKRGAAIPTS
jgi:putative GTP pyrophosphokinase